MEFHQSEKMDWREQFKRMKRWHYRIRDGTDNDREDFFLAFFECCHHFKDWLVKDKIATKKEVDEYIEKYYALQLCADICTFAKHAEVTRHPRTGDSGTEVIGQKLTVMPENSSTYTISVLKIKSGGKERYDAFTIVKECLDAWAQFLLSRSLEIPIMPQEIIFRNFRRWEPTFHATDPDFSQVEENKIRNLISQVNQLELGLYKNPSNEELLNELKNLTVEGRGKYEEVAERVRRARDKKVKINSESASHKVHVHKIIFTGTRGDTASAETIETSHWEWPDGNKFNQKGRPHAYYLMKLGAEWRVEDEDYSSPYGMDRIVSSQNI